MRRLGARKSKASLVPSDVSRITLQDYELTRLDLASRTRRQILAALDVWVTAQAEAQAARWLLEGSVDEQKGKEIGKSKKDQTEVPEVWEFSDVREAKDKRTDVPELRTGISAGGIEEEGAA